MPNPVDVETINPLLKSAVSVIQQVSGISAKPGKPSIQKTEFKEESVLIMLGVTGQLEGNVIFELKIDKAKLLASKMMMGYEVPELDAMAMSAISELGNMIMGNAATAFSSKNIAIDITPPTIARGTVTLSHQYAVNICVPLMDESGDVLLNLNIAIRADK